MKRLSFKSAQEATPRMSLIRLYVDEDAMDRGFVGGMRPRGFDVMTSIEAGMLGRCDEDIFSFATSLGRVVYTFNIGDFRRIHAAWLSAGRQHAGIIYSHQERYSSGEQIRRVVKPASCLSAEEMLNREEFLGRWF
jgi:hypothetical protein